MKEVGVMATELGQAYVQIMPSAKGISGSIQKQLDPEASSAGRSAGQKIGTGLKVAAVAGVAAAGAAMGKIISSSLSEGANLQQSLGGIETLFKGSANKVIKYADQAYKTSGLSANDYMENVTSFSASLLQSVAGDTNKAADTANMAMIDMSDNANKMGTNMGDIQNAYQGFAKQNYTMLDNLKLGYGGTKEEMQRLLTDAQKLTGVKYNINNLNDVYNAIHAVQGKLGITGTTAKEAAETFSGSFAAMKASLSNVLGNLSLGRDIGPSLQALAQTVSTFLFGNFIPMVGNILKGLPGAISTFISSATPYFLAGGKELIASLASGMGISIPSAFQGVGSSIFSTFGTVLGQLPSLFSTVIGAIVPIIQQIGLAFTQLDFSGFQALLTAVIPAIQNAFSTMMAIVAPAITMVVDSFVQMWNAAQPLISVLASALMPVLQVMGAFLGGVFKGILMGISAAFNVITTVIGILTPVVSFLVDVFKACAPALTTVAEWVGVVIGTFTSLTGSGSTLRNVLSSAWSNIKSAVSIAGGVIKGAISGIRSVFTALGSSGNVLKSILSSVWGGIRSVISAAGGVIRSIISAVGSSFSSMGSIFSSVGARVSGIINTIKNVINGLRNIDISGAGAAIMNGFLGGLKSAYEGVKNFVGGIASWIKEHKGPISNDKKLLIPAGQAIMGGLNSSLQDAFKQVQKTVSSMGDELQLEFGINVNADDFNNKNFERDVLTTLSNDPYKQNVNTITASNQTQDTNRTIEISVPVYLYKGAAREIGYATATYVDERNQLNTRRQGRLEGDR